MSFLGDLYDFGKSVFNTGKELLSGGGIAGSLARTAVLGLLVNQINKSVNKSNEAAITQTAALQPVDQGVRLQVPPNNNQKIPVLYGRAFFGGIISEAVLTADRKTMWYVITLSEKTGTKLSDDTASTYVFHDVYWGGQRVVFDSAGAGAGLTAAYSVDSNGNIDYSIDGLVTIYPFAGNSTTPQIFENYSNSTTLNYAYQLVPNWTSAYTMSDLVFAVVRIDYNADTGVNGLPDVIFEISNDMKMPGDVLLDYMTNTRYGAGVPLAEIYDE
jgi:hypothetical protein